MEEERLSEWDILALRVTAVLIGIVCLTYWIVEDDPLVGLGGILGIIVLVALTTDETSTFFRPIAKVYAPLVEATVILLIFLCWALFIHPVLYLMGPVIVIMGAITFCVLIPVSFLILLRGNRIESLGFNMNYTSLSLALTIFLCIVMVANVIIRLVLVPDALSYLVAPQTVELVLFQVIYAGITIGFCEELIFRGIIQNRVSIRFQSRIIGLILTTLLFAGLHVTTVYLGIGPSAGDLATSFFNALLTRLPLGIILGVIWNHSENIFLPWSVHAVNNISVAILMIGGII